MGWEEADEGWGHAATMWAYLCEPSCRPEYLKLHHVTGVGADMAYLDIACGSGFALKLAAEAGAKTHGIDASDRLLRIAAARVPDADLHHGDMHALPWPDATFDVATSFRGIWGNTPEAVAEAARVLKPGGRLGLSFLPIGVGDGPLAKIWAAMAPVSKEERRQMAAMGSIAVDGRAEEMCRDAGLDPGERLRVGFTTEYPTVELAVELSLTTGPAYTAMREHGRDKVAGAFMDAFTEMEVEGLGVRLPSVMELVVATKPES